MDIKYIITGYIGVGFLFTGQSIDSLYTPQAGSIISPEVILNEINFVNITLSADSPLEITQHFLDPYGVLQVLTLFKTHSGLLNGLLNIQLTIHPPLNDSTVKFVLNIKSLIIDRQHEEGLFLHNIDLEQGICQPGSYCHSWLWHCNTLCVDYPCTQSHLLYFLTSDI